MHAFQVRSGRNNGPEKAPSVFHTPCMSLNGKAESHPQKPTLFVEIPERCLEPEMQFHRSKRKSRSAGPGLGVFREAQFLVEGVCLGFSTQEIDQGLHFVLAAALLEHGVAVPSAFFGIHRVLPENCVEHVGRVYLRG